MYSILINNLEFCCNQNGKKKKIIVYFYCCCFISCIKLKMENGTFADILIKIVFPYTYKTSLPRCKQTIFFCLSPLMVSFVILVSVRWIIRCVCHCHSIKWYECVRLPRLTGCKAGNRKLLQIKMRNVNELNWRKKTIKGRQQQWHTSEWTK